MTGKAPGGRRPTIAELTASKPSRPTLQDFADATKDQEREFDVFGENGTPEKTEAPERPTTNENIDDSFNLFLNAIVPNCHATPLDERTFGDLFLKIRIAESDYAKAEAYYPRQ